MGIVNIISNKIPIYAVAILICTTTYLAYDNLRLRTDMSSTVLKFKGLANDISSLRKDNEQLAKKNKALSNSNNQLKNRHAMIKSRIIERNKKVNSTTIARMTKKMATAPARMVPILGIGVTATTTANDIHDSCNDMAETLKFEQELFGNSKPISTQTLCGVDVERKLQESALAMEADMTEFFDSSQTTYEEAYKNLGGYLHYLEERGTKSYADFMNNSGGFINYLKDQSDQQPKKEPPVQYNQTPVDYIKYLYYEHNFF